MKLNTRISSNRPRMGYSKTDGMDYIHWSKLNYTHIVEFLKEIKLPVNEDTAKFIYFNNNELNVDLDNNFCMRYNKDSFNKHIIECIIKNCRFIINTMENLYITNDKNIKPKVTKSAYDILDKFSKTQYPNNTLIKTINRQLIFDKLNENIHDIHISSGIISCLINHCNNKVYQLNSLLSNNLDINKCMVDITEFLSYVEIIANLLPFCGHINGLVSRHTAGRNILQENEINVLSKLDKEIILYAITTNSKIPDCIISKHKYMAPNNLTIKYITLMGVSL